MFERLLSAIRSSTVNTLFKMTFQVEQQAPALPRAEQPKTLVTNEEQISEALSGDRSIEEKVSAPVTVRAGASQAKERHVQHVGRNDPCSCGSGKKYKKCHGA
mgnify:CR=1 FL=1